MMLAVHAAWALTDVGVKREHNEDSFLIAPALGLFVVADGMGGHLGGETASRLTVEHVYRDIHNHAELLERAAPAENVAECVVAKLLGASFRGANSVVHKASRESRELFGMGTTGTALLIRRDRAIFAHVGDSRAYLIRGGRAVRMTQDHTIVADQLRDGHITEADARHSRFKNIITRSIGSEDDLDIDLGSLTAEPDDVFVLASDGLTNFITDPELADIVTLAGADPRTAAELVETAKRRGGDDNITVVLVAVGEGASDQPLHGPVAGGAAAGLLSTSAGSRLQAPGAQGRAGSDP